MIPKSEGVVRHMNRKYPWMLPFSWRNLATLGPGCKTLELMWLAPHICECGICKLVAGWPIHSRFLWFTVHKGNILVKTKICCFSPLLTLFNVLCLWQQFMKWSSGLLYGFHVSLVISYWSIVPLKSMTSPAPLPPSDFNLCGFLLGVFSLPGVVDQCVYFIDNVDGHVPCLRFIRLNGLDLCV